MEPATHKPTSNHPEWNESYYMVFYNKEHNIRGMSRLGFKPKKLESSAFFFLFLPNGSATGYHLVEETMHYPNSLKVGGEAIFKNFI